MSQEAEQAHSMHFVGMGGAGMSGIARIFLAQGFTVSGSDRSDSPGLRELEALGATVYPSHRSEQVPEQAQLVVSSAIAEDNPELRIARERGQLLLHRSEALALAMRAQRAIAVAGTHGKSTTSSMIATMLTALGRDPGFAIGAVVKNVGVNAHHGRGAEFVFEADESDGSFVNYTPEIAVVTNVEADHLDNYDDAGAIDHAFDTFAARICDTLVCSLDDPGSAALLERAHVPTKLSYGFQEGADYQISSLDEQEGASSFGEEAIITEAATQQSWKLSLAVPGAYNVANATAAFVVGRVLGIDGEQLVQGLGHFEGAGRRFDFTGEAAGVRVYDDYAHHPTEVSAALGAARKVAGSGKVVVLFQPHLFSRTRAFAKEFASALSLADHAVLLPIYPAREAPIPGVSSELISSHPAAGSIELVDAGQAPARIAELASAGDLVLTMGAGDVTSLGPAILAHLGEP